MKLTLVDRWDRVQELWVHNVQDPVLVDELGRSVLYLEDLGFRQKRRNEPGVHEPEWKKVTDAFITRPSLGLTTRWIDYPPEDKIYQIHFERLRDGLLMLTGKLLVGVSK